MNVRELAAKDEEMREVAAKGYAQAVRELQGACDNAMFALRRAENEEETPFSVNDILRWHNQLRDALLELRDLCDEHIDALQGERKPRLEDFPDTL